MAAAERVSVAVVGQLIKELGSRNVGRNEVAKAVAKNPAQVWAWANGRGKTAPGAVAQKLQALLTKKGGPQLDLWGPNDAPAPEAAPTRRGPKAAKGAKVAPKPMPASESAPTPASKPEATPTPSPVSEAYAAVQAETLALLAELETLTRQTSPEAATWGHVGSLGYARRLLVDLRAVLS